MDFVLLWCSRSLYSISNSVLEPCNEGDVLVMSRCFNDQIIKGILRKFGGWPLMCARDCEWLPFPLNQWKLRMDLKLPAPMGGNSAYFNPRSLSWKEHWKLFLWRWTVITAQFEEWRCLVTAKVSITMTWILSLVWPLTLQFTWFAVTRRLCHLHFYKESNITKWASRIADVFGGVLNGSECIWSKK